MICRIKYQKKYLTTEKITIVTGLIDCCDLDETAESITNKFCDMIVEAKKHCDNVEVFSILPCTKTNKYQTKPSQSVTFPGGCECCGERNHPTSRCCHENPVR